MMDWTQPQTWPKEMLHREFPHDFRVLLQDHDFEDTKYKIIMISIDDVVIPSIDDDDDRHFDCVTGEPSTAYIDYLVETMGKGTFIPPIVVGNVRSDSAKKWDWPYDGRHRLNAALRLGLTVVPAIDVTGRGDT